MIPYASQQMATAFRTVRNNTVRIAEEIPEDKYGWAPAPGTRSVGTLLAHIAVSPTFHDDLHRVKRITTLQGFDFAGLLARLHASENEPRTKSQVIELLATEGERFATWLGSLTPAFLAETYTDPSGQNPKSRFEGLLSAKEHEMHHRGQLMVMQRMLGMVPHLTRQMQERMAASAAAAAR